MANHCILSNAYRVYTFVQMCHWCSNEGVLVWASKEAVTQGKNSLAAKLAASPVWLSLTLDAEIFPSAGEQVLVELPFL